MTGKPAIDGVKSEILDLETLESPEDVECRDFPNFPKEIKGSQWVEILLWSHNFKSLTILWYIWHLSTCFSTEELFIHLCLALCYDKSDAQTLQFTPARTLSISGLKSRVLKLSFLSLKMMIKRGLESILKFTEPFQRYLLSCQANSASLGWYFCTGQQQFWRGSVNFKINFRPLFYHHF